VKKRIIAVFVAVSLMAVFTPTVSRAAVTPYFIAVNDALLPFGDDTMPFVSGGEFFVPVRVFEGVGVWSISSADQEIVRLYRGVSRFVEFDTLQGLVEDQDGNTLNWPSARRVGQRVYVPLRQVSEYFGFTFRTIDVPRSVIPDEQVRIIRIVSNAIFNDPTFVGVNERAMRSAYNNYFAPQPPIIPPIDPPVVPQPNFSDVTILLSFYDISAGSADGILDMLDIQATSGDHSCFFVSAGDIAENPGLIRRIAGSGHALGIWLENGTLKEYREASALLFEAAKIRTVIVSAGEAAEIALETAEMSGLIFWGDSHSFIDYDNLSVAAITGALPIESGARSNLMFSCSENAASILPGVYSFLSDNEYTIVRITETVEPIN